MIVQPRRGGLRLIQQHDHALVSGELALAWRDSGASPAVSDTLVLATSLHDLSWREADQSPTWHRATGRPFDFLDYPSDRKFQNAGDGIDQVAELHPYAAILVSLHYASFSGAPSAFQRAQRRRREELADALGGDMPDPGQSELDLALLRLFDLLSLHVCLTPPDADLGGVPSWLTGAYALPGSAGEVHLRWRGPNDIEVAPFPFGSAPLSLSIPHQDLEQSTFDSSSSLRGAWDAAERRVWRVRLVPAFRPSSARKQEEPTPAL